MTSTRPRPSNATMSENGRKRSEVTDMLCSPGCNSTGPSGAGPMCISSIDTVASVAGSVNTVSRPGSLRISTLTVIAASSPTTKVCCTS